MWDFFVVVGFWHIWKTVCMCVRVEVKTYISMKLNQTFTSSLSVCLSLLRAHLEVFFLPLSSSLTLDFFLSTCTQRCFKSDLPTHISNSVSTAALWFPLIQVLHVYLVICSKNFVAPFCSKATCTVAKQYIWPRFESFKSKLPCAWSLKLIV